MPLGPMKLSEIVCITDHRLHSHPKELKLNLLTFRSYNNQNQLRFQSVWIYLVLSGGVVPNDLTVAIIYN